MKKYTNRLIFTILSVVTLFSFTSCEDDYYWADGYLDRSSLMHPHQEL